MVTTANGNEKYAELKSWGKCVNSTLVNLDFSTKHSFVGSYHYTSTPTYVAAKLSGTAHCTSRSQRRLHEAYDDFVLMIYLKKGTACLSHRRYDGLVGAGSFIFIDGQKTHELAMEADFEHLVLRIPKSRFTSLHPAAMLMVDKPFFSDSVEVHAAVSILEMMLDIGLVKCGSIATMAEAVISLLADNLDFPGNQAMGQNDRHALLAGKIIKHLDKNFCSPEYSVSRLAKEIGLSRRYVDAILAESNTTFGKLILEKRLERCRTILADQRYLNRPITEIALESGFNDLSHFSRRFKQKFGLAPRALRAFAQDCDT